MIHVDAPGPLRPDLDARRELKFSFPGADVGALREVLLRRGNRIAHAGPVSTVSSLYLDDDRLGAVRANLDGVGIRQKIRLRWYDRDLPGTDPLMLETKWRRHRVTGKRRLAFRAEEPIEDLPLDTMLRALRDRVSPEDGHLLFRATTPTVLVRYRREHFVFPETGVRATLDYDLSFVSQWGRRHLSLAFPQERPGFALIEVKVPVGDAAAGRGLLRPLRARPERFSKYVTACQALGLASAS